MQVTFLANIFDRNNSKNMNTSRKITQDLWYVGASDRRLALFENMRPIPSGTSYNSYVLLDEKTVLLDTVDQAVSAQFLENLTAVLTGRALDYIVIHHVEPDHLASYNCILLWLYIFGCQ